MTMTNRTALRSRRLLPLAGLAGLTALALACTDTNPTTNDNDLGTADMAMGTAPEATSVMPATGPTSGMTLITITGNNFRTGATVTVGGQPCTQVTVVAATQITCMTPANLGKSGKFDIMVTVDGKSATLAQAFSYYLSMISFTPRPRIQTALGTRSLVLGDWNGDKKLDLATANENSSSVSVRLGSGDGDFAGGLDYNYVAGMASSPFSITSGDINGDGLPDLITPNGGTSNVSVLLGTSNGMFQTPASSSGGGSVGQFPQATVIGDFTGDGTNDVVSVSFTSTRLTLLVGTKMSQFTTAVTAMTQTSPWSLAIGDFNKDGKPDVVVPRISSSSNISVFLGTGMQATPFQAAANYTAGTNPYWVVTGDWNGDGNLDVAAANSGSNNVTVLLGSPSGMLTVSGTMLGVGMKPEHIATADFNNDGLPDLVTANTNGGDLSLLLAQDKMPTYANAQVVSPGSGIAPKWIAAADLNGDGKNDMVVVDYKTTSNSGVITLMNTSQ